ncbi:MAG: hypothetical protein Q7T01_04705 [bacterium]|nr:hypothetical protein [bacterium]
MYQIPLVIIAVALLAAPAAHATDASDDVYASDPVLSEQGSPQPAPATEVTGAERTNAQLPQSAEAPVTPPAPTPVPLRAPPPPAQRTAPARAEPSAPPQLDAASAPTQPEVRAAFLADRATAAAALQSDRAEHRAAVVTAREALVARIAEKRVALVERLEKIRDERTQERITRVDRRLDAINARTIASLSITADQLASVLDRIGSRGELARIHGADTASVARGVRAAAATIGASRSAIAVQAGRTYEILIGSEATMRSDVLRARQTLKADLGAIRAQVQSAHDAVTRAAAALEQIPRVGELTLS